jgi:selenocysteine-specific elongation factor
VTEHKRRVVGTAGHIDHGKTALVRALTGIDGDRLPEEKRRGITIDLGFANWITDEFQIGFVDVPGHERFVKNMLAGVGGIDAVMLVIAADESIKPQTREHLAICELLGIRRGVIVLTKSDLVDSDIIELVSLEVRELCAGTFLADAPLVAVSSTTGAGMDDLRAALLDTLRQLPERNSDRAPLRLPIDRVFSLRGFGTVVTGTLVSGSLKKESEVEIQPTGLKSRARSIEVHDDQRDVARAGERTSVNLADLSVEQLTRGDQITAPDAFAPSQVITVDLRLLSDAPELKDQTRIRVHHFASELLATVRFLDPERRVLGPGQSIVAQLRLEKPITATAGDRFVIRRYSPAITIGGGVILDAHLPRLSRATRPELFETLRSGSLNERLEAIIRMGGVRGASTKELAQRTGLMATDVSHGLQKANAVVRAGDALWLHRDALQQFRSRAMEFLTDYFKRTKMTVGVPKGEFVQKLIPFDVDQRIAQFLLDDLVKERIIVVGNDVVDVPGRSKEMGGAEGELARAIEARFREAGLQTPAVSELIKSIAQKPKVIEGVVGFLVKNGALIRLAEGVYVHREHIAGAAEQMAAHRGKMIDVSWFKELFGISRKIAIPLLEYFDRQGTTKRQGDQRLVL